MLQLLKSVQHLLAACTAAVVFVALSSEEDDVNSGEVLKFYVI